MHYKSATASSTLPFVCPVCKDTLAIEESSYLCRRCSNTYPILFGIPDFRLRSDRYLSLEDERDKARRLFEFGEHASFQEVVRFYYSITFDLPETMARRYQASILAGTERGRPIVEDLTSSGKSDVLVEIGCGTGGLLVAATRKFESIYGVDIALRWLVIAQKRLRENNVAATLVCAEAEALPFRPASFSHAVAVDLFEHVYDVDKVIENVGEVLKPNGTLWLSAVNRYCLGPHPLSGVWAIGYLPTKPRAWVLKRLKGIDLLRFANMVSPWEICRRLRDHGFIVLHARPKRVEGVDVHAYSALERWMIALYRWMRKVPLLRWILLGIGPAFEIVCRNAPIPGRCNPAYLEAEEHQ